MPAEIPNPDIQRIQLAIDHFKTTGQVDLETVSFAKEKFLPSQGLSSAEIESLGPIELMLKLETILNKKEETPSPASSIPTHIATQVQEPKTIDLKDEMEEFSQNLTSQIDNEIKRQLAGANSLDQAQAQISEIAKKVPETLEPLPSPAQVEQNVLKPPESGLDGALAELKEGDKINDWILKRIYSTSFGGKQIPFYELQNDRGALWTLNQEEIKAMLKKDLSRAESPQVTPSQSETTTPLLAATVPEPSKPLPQLSPEGPEIPVKTITQTPEIEKPTPPASTETVAKLSENQVKFLKKMAKDKESWDTLLSFTPKLWLSFWDAASTGRLGEIGLGADLTEEKLHDRDTTSLVTINKGDSVEKLLTAAGFELTATPADAILLGTHLLVNYDLLEKTRLKIADSGISISPILKEEEVLETTRKAKNADLDSYNQIKDALSFLPVAGHFKVIKKEKFTEIEKLLS